jgi:hypothetical protein
VNDLSVDRDTNSFLLLHEFPQEKLEKSWRDLLARVDSPSLCEAPEFFVDLPSSRDGVGTIGRIDGASLC